MLKSICNIYCNLDAHHELNKFNFEERENFFSQRIEKSSCTNKLFRLKQ